MIGRYQPIKMENQTSRSRLSKHNVILALKEQSCRRSDSGFKPRIIGENENNTGRKLLISCSSKVRITSLALSVSSNHRHRDAESDYGSDYGDDDGYDVHDVHDARDDRDDRGGSHDGARGGCDDQMKAYHGRSTYVRSCLQQ